MQDFLHSLTQGPLEFRQKVSERPHQDVTPPIHWNEQEERLWQLSRCTYALFFAPQLSAEVHPLSALSRVVVETKRDLLSLEGHSLKALCFGDRLKFDECVDNMNQLVYIAHEFSGNTTAHLCLAYIRYASVLSRAGFTEEAMRSSMLSIRYARETQRELYWVRAQVWHAALLSRAKRYVAALQLIEHLHDQYSGRLSDTDKGLLFGLQYSASIAQPDIDWDLARFYLEAHTAVASELSDEVQVGQLHALWRQQQIDALADAALDYLERAPLANHIYRYQALQLASQTRTSPARKKALEYAWRELHFERTAAASFNRQRLLQPLAQVTEPD